MDLNAATDLQLLLSSRDKEGGLPPPDLSAPHPFRGSGPGQHPACIHAPTGLFNSDALSAHYAFPSVCYLGPLPLHMTRSC